MEFDLVDEMMWEDLVEFISLEEAGLEEHFTDTAFGSQRDFYTEEGNE